MVVTKKISLSTQGTCDIVGIITCNYSRLIYQIA
jgi:hypothetical protein